LFFNAQLQLVNTQSQRIQSYVNFYRALAGGWVDEAGKISDRSQALGAKP